MRTWFGMFGRFGQSKTWSLMGFIAWSVGLTPSIALAQSALHLEWEGPPASEAIVLRRGPGVDPIEACAPPCVMTLPEGHYRVTIGGGALRTAFHLDEPVHRIRIVRESRSDLRSIGEVLGVFANGGFVLAFVTALIGVGIQELASTVGSGSGGSGGGMPDEFPIMIGIGVMIGVTFGAPALGLGLLEDRWDAHAY